MPSPPNEATRQLLAQIWDKNLPVLRERLALLDDSAAAAADGTLSPDACRKAGATAHKLAGSLGMFGYPDGTALARKLEVLFDSGLPDAAAATLVANLRAELQIQE